ncbi:hypothetical protein COP2_008955 [Malus domestica]
MLKMAGFPPNPEDGELWLPSDIFFNEAASSTSTLSRHHFSNTTDNLARQLASLSLLKQYQSPSLSNLQSLHRVRPAVRSTQLDYLTQRYFNLGDSHGFVQKGPIFHGYGTQHLHYHYQFMNPAQLQVGSFLETRNGIQKRQQNRVLPFQGRGNGSMGRFGRVCGGTGVFHPRVLHSTTTATATASNPEVKGKQGLRNREEIKAIKSVCSNAGLPRDWTY